MIKGLFTGLMAAALFAPAALAGSSRGVGAGVQGDINDTQTSGALPFTGIDLTLMFAAALLVLAVGFGIRRFGRDSA